MTPSGGTPLADNEFSIIRAIERNPAHTQRELSKSTGLSLGMTNILLKRLARKGCIKIKHLDWRRTQYLLTVKGLMEKSRKSYAYALHTMRQFAIIRERIRRTVLAEHARGVRSALVVAWPETEEMLRQALAESAPADLAMEYLETFKHLGSRPGVVFTATVEPPPAPKPGQRLIPLLEIDDLRFKL